MLVEKYMDTQVLVKSTKYNILHEIYIIKKKQILQFKYCSCAHVASVLWYIGVQRDQIQSFRVRLCPTAFWTVQKTQISIFHRPAVMMIQRFNSYMIILAFYQNSTAYIYLLEHSDFLQNYMLLIINST